MEDNQTTAVAETSIEELLAAPVEATAPEGDPQLKAVIEAIIYVTEEPLQTEQIAAALQQSVETVGRILSELAAEYEKPEHGIGVREVAGGFKMATKAEHHDSVRNFVRSLKPPLKLSLAALETLAVVAYKQPVTAPEIADIRGVQGTGVLKTLLDRKLIAAAGRKNVIGKPILYKTTKDFLVQFGLKDLSELPSLKEFEEIRRMAFADDAPPPQAEPSPADGPTPDQQALENLNLTAVPDPLGGTGGFACPDEDSLHAGSAGSDQAEPEASAPAAAESQTPPTSPPTPEE